MNLKISLFTVVFLSIVCVFFSNRSVAQFDLGILAGVNVSGFRNTKADKNIITYQAGLVGSFSIITFKKFQVEIFPQLVWHRKGADMEENVIQNDASIRYTNHLVSDYLQLNLPIGGKWNFQVLQPMVYLVPYFGYCVSTHNQWSTENHSLPVYIPRSIDAGIKICAGIGVRRVRFLFSYNLGMISVNKNKPSFYHDAFEVSLSYFFFNQLFSKK